MTRRARLAAAIAAAVTAVTALAGATPALAVAPSAVAAAPAQTGCYFSATAPAPGPGQVVLWTPAQPYSPNTVVLDVGQQSTDPQCTGAFESPHVVSVAPGSALVAVGMDMSGGTGLRSPWGAQSISGTVPVDISKGADAENWQNTVGAVALTAMQLVAQYQTCAYCLLDGQTVALDAYDADFTRAQLVGSTLTGNWEGAKLGGADLTGATVKADLSNAGLTGATVDRTAFPGAKLQGAVLHALVYRNPPDLSGATIGGTTLGRCTDLGGNDLLEVGYAELGWDDTACTGAVFGGSTVPFGMLGPIYTTGQAKKVDLSGARIVSSARDRGALAGGDLRGVDLTGFTVLGPALDLTGVKLDGATLTDAQFPLATLSGASLTDVDASGLNLSGARLSPGPTSPVAAVLSGATTNLENADFVAADISGVGFVGADISNADFTRVLGRDVDFTGVKAVSTTFAHAHLYGNGGAFDGATDLSGVDFTGAVLASAVTETGGFSLTKAILKGARLDGVVCVACDFSGAHLDDATLTGAYLPGVQLGTATLTGAHFAGAWLYCGSPQETACTTPPATTPAWPLALGTGEAYGPVPYTSTTATGSTLTGVVSCPSGQPGGSGCANQMLPSGSTTVPPIPAPCSASAHGSCPETTRTLLATTGPPGAAPLSLAAAAPLTWSSGLPARGWYTGYDDHTVRLVSSGAGQVVAGRPRAACPSPTQACGDGGPATSALLGTPSAVAVGLDGSVYLADSALRRVRVVSPTGTISTVAGNGAACGGPSCGDGGAATSAALTAAQGVAVDSHGALYIADGAAGLRKVGPLGTLTTVAPGTRTGTVVSVAIGLDGTLFAATRGPDGIIGVDPATGAVTPLVGTGTSGYNGNADDLGPLAGTSAQVAQPTGLSVTLDGYLAFADTGNHLVRRYNIATQAMAENLAGVVDASGTPQGGTTADGQPADRTELLRPLAVAATATAEYVVTDTGNDAVRVVGPYASPADVGGPAQPVRKILACRPGVTWTCQLQPPPSGTPRTTTTGAVTVTRDGRTYASGPMLLQGGGGLRYLVDADAALVPGRYTLSRQTGGKTRSYPVQVTTG